MAHAAVPVSGDEADFAERYRVHRSRVIGLCRRLLGSADQAEDAAHEVFVRAHTRQEQFDVSGSFASWVHGIATHYCLDLLRRRSREAKLFGCEEVERRAAASDTLDPLGLLLAREQQQELRQAIRALPEKYRVPLVLSLYHDRTHEEIGSALGIPRSHVAILVFRARQHLRKALAHTIDIAGSQP
jgi:RNA polymerase sigma-70 factor (ECF subfamily)